MSRTIGCRVQRNKQIERHMFAMMMLFAQIQQSSAYTLNRFCVLCRLIKFVGFWLNKKRKKPSEQASEWDRNETKYTSNQENISRRVCVCVCGVLFMRIANERFYERKKQQTVYGRFFLPLSIAIAVCCFICKHFRTQNIIKMKCNIFSSE